MALEYELTLAGTTPVEVLAERALPDPEERPTGTPPLLSAALWDRYGFMVTVLAGQDGYVSAGADSGMWEWEPGAYVSLSFRLDKFADLDREVTEMLTIVRRVLDSGPEDSTFTLNGDVLLFARFGGELVKHRRESWWSSYASADSIIAG
ncbi:SitI3 family protein [Pseudosporangium ferrugineum]|uniref:Uncharacterized protein n=1 Tax=Pseudosporangium ferrugineum TaxID=439699 RepID=A0A2T0S3L2_9ACTN|nr:SitI3 family protein [Pseudosporangium ferrugineum]PRY27989.1 hypothetical protein CLV70_109145 [Pseudosporangium ferrugineum]